MMTVIVSILDLVSQNLTELVLSKLGVECSWIRRWDPVDFAFLEELLLLCWTLRTGLHIFMTGKSKRSFAKIHVLSKEKVFKQT